MKTTQEGKSDAKSGSVKRKKSINSFTSFLSLRKRLKKQVSYQPKPQLAFMNYSIKNSRSSIQSSLMVLYGLTLIILGAILPISDAFATTIHSQTEGDHKYYLEVFFLTLYTTGIIIICYLLLVIYIAGKRTRKKIKLRQKKESLSSEVFEMSPSIGGGVDKSSTVKFEIFDLNSGSENKNGPGPEINPSELPTVSRRGYPEDETRLFEVKEPSRSSLVRSVTAPHSLRNGQNENGKLSERVKFELSGHSVIGSSVGSIESSVFSPDVECSQKKHDINDAICNSLEGVNLYLRLGAVGFGFGVMVHDGFKISDQWDNENPHCRSLLWTPKHMLCFNRQKPILRLILCHMALTNVCGWLKTVVFEIREEMDKMHLESFSTNNEKNTLNFSTSNDSQKINNTTHCHPGYSEILAPYLFPCAIEYSLISAAIFYKMFQKVGHAKHKRQSARSTVKNSVKEEKTPECHKSHKGLFVGLLIVMATLVAIALFFLFFDKKDKKEIALVIYQSTEIFLLAVTLISCVVAYFSFNRLRFQSLTEEGAFDVNLLIIGLAGIVSYNLFLFVPAMEQLNIGIIAHLYAIKSLLELVQALVQVFFILEASRRCAKNEQQCRQKPGRAIVTFLLAANLAMWIVNTFEVKRAEDHKIHRGYYSHLPWIILTRLLLPLVIFFRFHSTVCLSDLWVKPYKLKQHD